MRKFLMLMGVVCFMGVSCVQNKNPQQMQSVVQPVTQKLFEVTEVIHGGSYTYLNVTENMTDRWVAVSKQEVNKGDVYYYDEALQMNNFHSKEIDRTFETIYFVNQISKTALTQNPMGGMPAHTGKVETKSAEINLNKKEGELTIANLFLKKAEFTSQEFEIRGIVVKVNEQVMGKNWVHIQDGTKNADSFDLTITTQENVEVGNEVIFKGKLTLDKNFGSGYFYDVIMEDAVLINKTVS